MVASAVEVPKKEGFGPGERIPVLTKRKARNLYLFEDASHERIAAECGLTLGSARTLVSREGWTKERRERMRSLVKKQDARMSGIDSEMIEAIASHSEQYALRALQKTGEALERTDPAAAKDAQAYSSTVKNLATVAKAMRETGPANPGEGASLTLNMFFAGAASKGDVKQVTEISATPIK